MSTKLFVGNLSFNTTSDDLVALCGEFGSVASAQIVTDRETGRSRGFAFVKLDYATKLDPKYYEGGPSATPTVVPNSVVRLCMRSAAPLRPATSSAECPAYSGSISGCTMVTVPSRSMYRASRRARPTRPAATSRPPH